MSRPLTIVFVVLTMLLGLAFHLRNGQYVTIDYYVDSVTLPLSLWLFVWIVAGICLGLLAIVPTLLRMRREIRRLRREVRRLETDPDKHIAAGNVS